MLVEDGVDNNGVFVVDEVERVRKSEDASATNETSCNRKAQGGFADAPERVGDRAEETAT